MDFHHWIFFLLITPVATQANVVSDHIKPTIRDGFDSKGLYIALGGVAAVALAQTKDLEIRENHGNHRAMSADNARIGDFLGTGIPGGIIALSQIYSDNPNGLAHAEALADTFVVTTILKGVNQRNRPSSDNRHAMPSGHTSTTFATATSLSYAYGWAVAVPSYALATFTAASRIADDAHWFSDTVAGAVIGIFWGRATYFHHVTVAPVLLDGGGGLFWSRKF